MAGGASWVMRCSAASSSAIAIAPFAERGFQRRRVGRGLGEPRGRLGAIGLGLLHFRGGFEQRLVETGAVELHRLDVGLDLAALLLGRLQIGLDAA